MVRKLITKEMAMEMSENSIRVHIGDIHKELESHGIENEDCRRIVNSLMNLGIGIDRFREK